jgi:hypothetical protein
VRDAKDLARRANGCVVRLEHARAREGFASLHPLASGMPSSTLVRTRLPLAVALAALVSAVLNLGVWRAGEAFARMTIGWREVVLFDNRFVAELPGDPEVSLRPRQVLGACWSPAIPTPVARPRLFAHSREVAELVGLTEEDVASPRFAEVFGGNALLPAWSRTRPATAGTSSATGPGSSATAGPSRWARW